MKKCWSCVNNCGKTKSEKGSKICINCGSQIVKKCSKCQVYLVYSELNFNKDSKNVQGLRNCCINCSKENFKDYRSRNRDKEKLRAKCQWAKVKNDPDKKIKRKLTRVNLESKYRLKNNHKIKNSFKISVGKLSDSYVKSRIYYDFGIDKSEIPKQLIETKRLIIKIKRELNKK